MRVGTVAIATVNGLNAMHRIESGNLRFWADLRWRLVEAGAILFFGEPAK
jgi:hypothetical protein